MFVACATVALGVPSPADRQEQKPVTEVYNNLFNQNPMNNGWMFGKSGSWPGFGQMVPKQPAFPFPTGNVAMPKMDGVDTIEASAGMSCTVQNGKKKCTKH